MLDGASTGAGRRQAPAATALLTRAQCCVTCPGTLFQDETNLCLSSRNTRPILLHAQHHGPNHSLSFWNLPVNATRLAGRREEGVRLYRDSNKVLNRNLASCEKPPPMAGQRTSRAESLRTAQRAPGSAGCCLPSPSLPPHIPAVVHARACPPVCLSLWYTCALHCTVHACVVCSCVHMARVACMHECVLCSLHVCSTMHTCAACVWDTRELVQACVTG